MNPRAELITSVLVLVAIAVVLFVFFIVDSNMAKADSLICRDNSKTQIYIETKDIEVDIDNRLKALGGMIVKDVSLAGEAMFRVSTHGNDQWTNWQINAGIPCVLIVEETGVTTSLERYLKLTGSWVLKE